MTPQDEALCPEPNWAEYKGMGNVLRHAYHRVDDEVIWDTVQLDLPKLKRAVAGALATHFPVANSPES